MVAASIIEGTAEELPAFGTAWPTKEGFVVTNNHVVANLNDLIFLRRSDGEIIQASVVLRDPINDLVLLKALDAAKLPPALPLANEQAQLGASVFTIGYPHPLIMGTAPKLTTGNITATRGLRDDPRTYQISLPIQGGNSGGPLLNMRGEVIGITTTKLDALWTYLATGDLPQNVNYAIKVDYLRPLIASAFSPGIIKEATPALKNLSLEELAQNLQGSVLMVVAGTQEAFIQPPQVPLPNRVPEPAAPEENRAILNQFAAISRGLLDFRSYSATELDSTKLSAISTTFSVPVEAITAFQWGKSPAGKGQPLEGSSYYTVKYQAGGQSFSRIIRVGLRGNIIAVEDKQ